MSPLNLLLLMSFLNNYVLSQTPLVNDNKLLLSVAMTFFFQYYGTLPDKLATIKIDRQAALRA